MAYFRIHNKGTLWRHEEAVAAGTITPGMLCEITTSGTIQAHSTAGGRGERLVALEDALQGRGVDTDYSAAEIVQFAVMEPGGVFNMLMAAGETGSPGQEVVSGGDGTVILASNLDSSGLNLQVIGRIDASEATFTALVANTLKAIRMI
jgi:hypothetical protein